MEFSGIAALVTGGSSGIGRATVEELLRRGARVACLDLEPDLAPEGSVGVACDVSDDESVRVAVAAVVELLGGLDVVVNNAGIGATGTVSDNDEAEWHRVLDVNVVGIARVTRAALPALRRSRAAAVVNIGSIGAWTGLPQRALYCASKGAVQALTLAMAVDHLGDQVRVNCVNPGTADTPWVARLLDAAEDAESARAALLARQPTGRLVSPQEVATAVCYLASPLSRSTTGAVLAVDGGSHSLRPSAPAARSPEPS